jgi:hypothetical protein
MRLFSFGNPEMKFPRTPLVLAIVYCFVTPAPAQEGSNLQARVAARHELELAKIELRNFWQIEYPRRRRDLNAVIELTEMEVRNYQDLLNEYRPFTQFSLGEPFPVTIRNLQMCLKEAELRLRNLYADRNALIRFKGDEFRILEMRVQEARLRVSELESGD